MPRFAANLDWMFGEHSFLKRFGAAAANGFRGVEFLFPYDHSVDAIADALRQHELTNVLFNLPAGDWSAGERGIAALPGRESEFRDSLELALLYSGPLKTKRLHVLAGIVPSGDKREEYRSVYLANLRYAADRVAQLGITLLVEAINATDMPGYLIGNQAESFALCKSVQRDNVRMQVDLYHMQMTGGSLAAGLRRYHTACSHVQIAGVPGRHEPNVGEVNYSYLFGLLDALGYDGWVGCEYQPLGNTVEGLGWFEAQIG